MQDLLLAVLVETDDIKLAPNHGEMPSLLARVKPSALVKHVQLQKVPPPPPPPSRLPILHRNALLRSSGMEQAAPHRFRVYRHLLLR